MSHIGNKNCQPELTSEGQSTVSFAVNDTLGFLSLYVDFLWADDLISPVHLFF